MKRIIRIGMDVHSTNYTLCAMEPIIGEDDRIFATIDVTPDYKNILMFIESLKMKLGVDNQYDILLDYSSDFAKHAPKTDIPKLGWIWESIPKQLAKDNNKFVFSHVKAGKRSNELEDALEWLVDAGLVHRLELVKNPELPLSFCADATFFKVYMADVGLLRRKSGVSHRTIMEDSELYKNFKGAFTENFVLNELISQGIHPYFWRSGNTAELDFLFEYDDAIIPVEAKAELYTRAKSYQQFCKKISSGCWI